MSRTRSAIELLIMIAVTAVVTGVVLLVFLRYRRDLATERCLENLVQVTDGERPGDLRCPRVGVPYAIEGGVLRCPAPAPRDRHMPGDPRFERTPTGTWRFTASAPAGATGTSLVVREDVAGLTVEAPGARWRPLLLGGGFVIFLAFLARAALREPSAERQGSLVGCFGILGGLGILALAFAAGDWASVHLQVPRGRRAVVVVRVYPFGLLTRARRIDFVRALAPDSELRALSAIHGTEGDLESTPLIDLEPEDAALLPRLAAALEGRP